MSSVEKDPITASQLYMTAKHKLCSLIVSQSGLQGDKSDILIFLNDYEFKQFVRSPNEMCITQSLWQSHSTDLRL